MTLNPHPTPSQIAVFFDRDGTLNEERGYLRELDQLALMPGVAQAMRKLNDAGILTILVTNQSGPARGFYGEDHVVALNQRLAQLLETEAGAHMDAMFYCPHLPPGKSNVQDERYAKDCDCRKPNTGMIFQAMERFPQIDIAKSYMLGDKASDVQLAHNAGCKGVLLTTGYGERVLAGKYQSLDVQPYWVCDTMVHAVDKILEETSHSPIYIN